MINNQPVLFITRKAHFNAAHKLFNPNWSKEKNDEIFGKCANENWHGHNFDLHITIKGFVNQETGFVMDLKQLKKIIETEIVEPLDHKNLNLDVPFLIGKLPSIENIVIEIWNILEKFMPSNAKLHKILLVETKNNSVEYYGPNTVF